MPAVATIKPTHKAIQTYYAALLEYGGQHVSHETALRSAFQNVLAETSHPRGWTLIPELSLKVGGKTVRPDGTLRDEYYLPRGYWEAKDTADDLDDEIRKKAAKGYPLINTIFEDTRQAVLYQDGREAFRADLTKPQELADLLNQFYSYAQPDIESFEQAVAEFQERVPELARGLAEKIKQAHGDNKRFQATYAAFFELCQATLNPNISQAAVDEMLVQHLLTERLIRKIFDNPEFTRRNVIAAEVEKVIDALVSRSFDRDDFLRSLDRFYRAIEDAAHRLTDFGEKQHFLNSIYERFFRGYSVKIADTHGIVYTPQPIVDFMCASVVEALQAEFGRSLGDPDVVILDPCTGTGSFIVNLLRRAARRDLDDLYRNRLFANEVMLLPYYIAALNIEHTYYELTGDYEAFEGLCFVDTLDLQLFKQGEDKPEKLPYFAISERNSERIKRQTEAPIKVIIGNPPYNVGQLNENDKTKTVSTQS
jgi:Type ISP restriction-modification enzyme, coupler domain/N-6 DNA Methylase